MSDVDQTTANADEPRRSFVAEFGSILLGGIVSLGPLLVGLFNFADPLLRRVSVPRKHRPDGSDGADDMVRVATKEELSADGVPRRFTVIMDRVDAWNFEPDQPVGAVYLSLQKAEGGADKVLAFNATCPHAGCSVSFDAASRGFFCPCHNSSFDQQGEKLDLPGRENPSPRPLDTLEVDQQRFVETGEVWLKFENYYTGRHEKKAKI